jgi:hypothetical protein
MSTQPVQAMSERNSAPISLDQRKLWSPTAVLKDLVELLEDYGPAWYTEEHHNRAVAALHSRTS